uniref:Cilia- and flagella-associated protein 300 n=1 Tax=Trypanosoma congolense (strain IL3000) TaxID=1068625 RepID=G0UT64_TRYCI|nr:unnamed protein product [Trypanosoma congolense IL3000]
MVQRETFTFEAIKRRRVESLMSEPFFKEAFHRWGLHHSTRVCAFRFERNAASAGSVTGAVASGPLRFSGFHRGLLGEFLMSLFEAPALREELKLRETDRDKSSCPGTVDYCELQCRWTTLDPFRRLVDAGIVRRVEEVEKDRTDCGTALQNEYEAPLFDGARMPIVRRADVYLPHDIAVCDELRALFLLAHNKSAGHIVDGGDDEDFYMYGGSCGLGCGASLAALRRVFEKEEERAEFLYHIVWRLVAGGGTANQWDDELTMYLEAARMFYKSLVSIRAVPGAAESSGGGVEEVDHNADGGCAPESLRPEVVSTVASVQAVAGLRLFENDDDASPSNLNYCYVCIDPLQAEVVVWYHSF